MVYLVSAVVVVCCYGIQALDAKGCRLLAIFCKEEPDCDREVLLNKCAKYLVRRDKNVKETNKGDAVSIPPMSLLVPWPFIPDTFGPGKKIQQEPTYHRSKAEDGSHVQRNVGLISEEKQLRQRKSWRYDNEASDYRAVDNDGRNDEAGGSRLARNLQRSFAENKINMAENSKDTSSYQAGVDPHGDDIGRHSNAADDLYSRLVRLAKLHDALNWQKKELANRVSEVQDSSLLYDLYEPKSVKSLFLKDRAYKEAEPSGRYGRTGLNIPAGIIALQETKPSDQLSTRVSGQQESRPLVDASTPRNSNKESPSKDKKAIDEKSVYHLKPELPTVKDSVKEQHWRPSLVGYGLVASTAQKPASWKEGGILILRTSSKIDPNSLKSVGGKLQKVLWNIDPDKRKIFSKISIDPANSKELDLRMQVPTNVYSSEFNLKVLADKINTDTTLRSNISKATGLSVVHARSKRSSPSAPYALPKDKNWDEFAIITAIVGGCTLGLIVASVLICSLKRRKPNKNPIELQKKEALSDYEELCRAQMAVNSSSSPRTMKAIQADRQRHGLIDCQGKVTKKTWREEPLAYNMDITTGHVILSYMEDHLKNENKLSTEWDALCNYKADQDDTTSGGDSKNLIKNRYSNVLPYDHTRVKLRETANVFHSDYINASYITDADPRNPAYIATQGPLDNTVADFWQMIWEQGVVVIVNLTRLSDMGLPQCHRYWPEEGSEVYNTYQVHLISEHIWCDDYIVRSFYLKHLVTSETRTVTQFHFLTWPDLSVPESSKPILEFRRKVNKCYRGQACPIVVHCNNGIGRTGTYILIDMVLKKMIKGTKEIDIAATLEYLRDQRQDMVKTKAQFEFTLASVAEEVTAILSSLSS